MMSSAAETMDCWSRPGDRSKAAGGCSSPDALMLSGYREDRYFEILLQTTATEQMLEIEAGTTEHQLTRLGPPEVQVGGVLPGKADPAVDLDVLRGHEHEALRADRVRHRRRLRQRRGVGVARSGPRGLGRGGLRELDLDEHVGALVL